MFLTRIPAPYVVPWHEKSLSQAAPFFPVVGLILGALCGGIFALGSHLWSPAVGAALSLLAGALLSGAMHEDGLADSCDGLWGGQNPEQRREILKDSRMGAYGSLSMVLAALLKFSALSLLSPKAGLLALIFAHSWGRAMPALLMGTLPYGGNAQRAKSTYTEGLPLAPMLWTLGLLGLMSGVAWIWISPQLCWLWAYLLLLWIFLRRLFLAKIEGYTGDTLGAAEQCMEIGVLLAWGLL